MKHFRLFFFLLAIFGLSFNLHAQITGNYKGTANVKCALLSIDETIEDAVVTLKASGSEYCLEVQEIDMGGGVTVPAYDVCGITATPSGTNYILTAAPVSFIIPELTIPPNSLFPSGATFTDVPATVKLTNGLVAGNTLTLKIEVTITVMMGPVPIPITLTVDYSGTKIAAPFEGDGTENNPYLIYTPVDLSNMSNS